MKNEYVNDENIKSLIKKIISNMIMKITQIKLSTKKMNFLII